MKSTTEKDRIRQDIENLENWLKNCKFPAMKKDIKEQIKTQKQLLKTL